MMGGGEDIIMCGLATIELTSIEERSRTNSPSLPSSQR